MVFLLMVATTSPLPAIALVLGLVGLGLCVTVWTYQSRVFRGTVFVVSILVVCLKRNWLTHPCCLTAYGALVSIAPKKSPL